MIVKDTVSFAAAQGIRLPCRLERISVKQKATEMRVFTQEEQRKLTTFLLDSPDTYKFAVLLCLYTGLRIGEVCALRWCCIDMGRQVLRVQATAQRVRDPEPGGGPKTKMLYAEPKSKCSIRDIPLPEQMLPLMKNFEEIPMTLSCQIRRINARTRGRCSIVLSGISPCAGSRTPTFTPCAILLLHAAWRKASS